MIRFLHALTCFLFIILLPTGMPVASSQLIEPKNYWAVRMKRDPFDVVAIFNRAQELQEAGRFTEALVLFDKVESLRPREDFYLPMQANVLEKMQRHGKALELWNKLVFLYPDESEARKRLYQSALYNKDWQLAFDASVWLSNQKTKDVGMWLERMAVLALRQLNRPKDAAESWWKLWELGGDHLALYQSLNILKSTAETELLSEKISLLEKNGHLAEHRRAAGYVLFRAFDLRREGKLQEVIHELLSIEAKELFNLRDQELALAYLEIEQYDKAGATLETIHQRFPTPEISCQLVKLYQLVDDNSRSLAVLKKADHSEMDYVCQDIKARLLALHGDFGDATAIFSSWLSQLPQDFRAHWSKSMVHFLNRDWSQFTHHLEQARLSPLYEKRALMLDKLNGWRDKKMDKARLPASIKASP